MNKIDLAAVFLILLILAASVIFVTSNKVGSGGSRDWTGFDRLIPESFVLTSEEGSSIFYVLFKNTEIAKVRIDDLRVSVSGQECNGEFNIQTESVGGEFAPESVFLLSIDGCPAVETGEKYHTALNVKYTFSPTGAAEERTDGGNVLCPCGTAKDISENSGGGLDIRSMVMGLVGILVLVLVAVLYVKKKQMDRPIIVKDADDMDDIPVRDDVY